MHRAAVVLHLRNTGYFESWERECSTEAQRALNGQSRDGLLSRKSQNMHIFIKINV